LILAIFAVLIATGIPIAFVLGFSSLIYLVKIEMPLVLIPQRMFVGLNSFLLLAVPLFVVAGKLMNETGITDRLVAFASLLLGRLRGGLAYVNIVASMLFAGITGTGAADTSAIGSVMIPAMKKQGYRADYSAAVTAISSVIGPVIPPSLAMLVYGAIAQVSIAKLFLGGVIPGILLGLVQIAIAAAYAKVRHHPLRMEKLSFRRSVRITYEALLGLVMPVIIIGGILSGVFTATESATIAVLYALLVGFFVYRKLTFSKLGRVLLEAGILIGPVLVIIATANLFGWILTAEGIPDTIAAFITSLTSNPYLILLLMNIVFLFVGTFMETLASIILLTPIFLPLVTGIGIDPVHFGIILVVNLNIGLTTPPLGVCMFIACPLAGISIKDFVRAIWPFLLASIGVLFLITYVPGLVMFIPNLIR